LFALFHKFEWNQADFIIKQEFGNSGHRKQFVDLAKEHPFVSGVHTEFDYRGPQFSIRQNLAGIEPQLGE
jgi:hypothetical protein